MSRMTNVLTKEREYLITFIFQNFELSCIVHQNSKVDTACWLPSKVCRVLIDKEQQKFQVQRQGKITIDFCSQLNLFQNGALKFLNALIF